MDCALAPVSDDGDQWSDNHSMESDDGFQASPPWVGPPRPQPMPISVAPTMSILYTGQLSPISDGVDAPGRAGRAGHPPSSSSGPPAAHSAMSSSSSFSDSWGTGCDDSDDVAGMEGEGEGDCEGGKGGEGDGCWEHGSDGFMAVPKLEPMDDDDFRLEDLQEAPHTPMQTSPEGEPMRPLPLKAEKRPRGRPRKHPLAPNVATNKVTKGRSKTGCLTCRKRKKKCDESKPRCMNCEKNAVVCEGYPEKQIWKSGKERAEEERMKTYSRPSITMQPIFHGLETVEDMIFWKHYNNRLSAVLTVEGEHRNAFKDFIVPVAVRHQGLMHSILSLSSRHMGFDTPYGLSVLRDNPNTSVEALRRRSEHHHEQAIKRLYQDIERHVQLPRSSPGYREILSARYGQMLCLLLESTVEGNPRGEHRVHLQAYKSLIRHSPPDCDPDFLAFFTEFFQYHIFADELLNVPEVDLDDIKSEKSDDANSAPALTPAKPLARETLDHQPWQPAAPMQSPRLLGVADGLLCHLTKITAIRRRIRANMRAQVDPVVDYGSLYEAAEIEAAIREWHPQWPPGDSRDRVGLLYKQMMWIYLFRTIYPPSCSPPCPSPSSPPLTSSSSAPSAPNQVQGSSSFDANTPPHSDYTSCASSPSPPSSTAATATADRGGGACPGTSHSNPSSRENSASDARAAPGSSDTRGRASTSLRHAAALGLPPISTAATAAATAAAATAATATAATAAVPAPAPAPSRAVGGATAGGRAESPAPIRQPPQQDPRITLAVEESLAVMESFERGDPVQTLLLIPCLVVGAACFAPAQRARVLRAVEVVRGYTGMRNTDRVAELLAEVWRLMDRGDWAQVWDWQAVARQQGLDFLCA